VRLCYLRISNQLLNAFAFESFYYTIPYNTSKCEWAYSSIKQCRKIIQRKYALRWMAINHFQNSEDSIAKTIFKFTKR
jgi:hypothetical protein